MNLDQQIAPARSNAIADHCCGYDAMPVSIPDGDHPCEVISPPDTVLIVHGKCVNVGILHEDARNYGGVAAHVPHLLQLQSLPHPHPNSPH